MLRAVEHLRGLEITGEDGSIGSLEDVYFDHEEWRLRHAVVFTGSWLRGRWIVLPAPLLREVDPMGRTLRATTSRNRIGGAPIPETDCPINRAFEKALYTHYGCEPYWRNVGTVGDGTGRLLSAEELKGYHVDARDGEVGRLEDYLVDEEDWAIRYLCLAARRWLPGRRMAAPTDWVHLVNWRHKRVSLRHFREEILKAPEFGGPGSLSPEFSRALEAYFAGSGPGCAGSTIFP